MNQTGVDARAAFESKRGGAPGATADCVSRRVTSEAEIRKVKLEKGEEKNQDLSTRSILGQPGPEKQNGPSVSTQ